MKDPRYTELICKRSCSYYRPGKDKFSCGAYEFIRRNLTPGELAAVVKGTSGDADPCANDLNAVCECCAFYEGGCDFAAKGKALSTREMESETPCGGYKILSRGQ